MAMHSSLSFIHLLKFRLNDPTWALKVPWLLGENNAYNGKGHWTRSRGRAVWEWAVNCTTISDSPQKVGTEEISNLLQNITTYLQQWN
jgi:hypothetical protein